MFRIMRLGIAAAVLVFAVVAATAAAVQRDRPGA